MNTLILKPPTPCAGNAAPDAQPFARTAPARQAEISPARLILNRDFELPADGWYHIAPLGEFPHAAAGVVQIIDADACRAIVNAFRDQAAKPNFPGLLIDFDHFSLDRQKPSEAAGWISDVQFREPALDISRQEKPRR